VRFSIIEISLKKYTYVLNNPLSNVDRNGRECVSILRENRSNESNESTPFAKGHVGMPIDGFNLFVLLVALASAFLLSLCVITVIAGLAQAAAVIVILSKVFTCLSVILAFVTIARQLDRDYAEFWETMDEWLAENDYTSKDIVDAEFIDDDTIIVTLDDGTEITIRRKKTGFYVDEEESDIGDDGDGDTSSSLDITPPGNINHLPIPI
jgi:hypothetical protein